MDNFGKNFEDKPQKKKRLNTLLKRFGKQEAPSKGMKAAD